MVILKIVRSWSLLQNSVSFVKGSGKSGLRSAFSHKSKVDFPKTEVLGNPLVSLIPGGNLFRPEILEKIMEENMKRQLVKTLCMVTALSLFAACGKSSGPAASSAAPRSSSVSTSGENWWENVDFSKKVTLVLASTSSRIDQGSALSTTHAIRLINERSKGAILFDQKMNGVLGNEQSTFAQVMEGSLDISGCGSGSISQYTPYLDVFTLPFLINSYELEAKVFQTPEWKALIAKANEALGSCTIISINEFGMRQFATVQKPIKTMADIKGLKIRSIGNPVIDEALKLVGANPVNITFSDLYSALQNKVVDGEEINATSVSMQKHYEVVKYISEIGFYPFLSMLVMSNETIKSLPDGYFDLIKACFDESNAYYMQKTIYEWDQQGRQDCIDHGILFNTIEDKEAWQKAMAPLYEKKMAEDPLYASFIRAVQALQ
jgi:TRAP-type C4-dicarboxylate transport system substrate-binding protein